MWKRVEICGNDCDRPKPQFWVSDETENETETETETETLAETMAKTETWGNFSKYDFPARFEPKLQAKTEVEKFSVDH